MLSLRSYDAVDIYVQIVSASVKAGTFVSISSTVLIDYGKLMNKLFSIRFS